MSCAFFDMDGTLVNGDTNDLFFKHLLSIKLVDNSFLEPMHEFHQLYYEGKLKIVKLNTDENLKTAKEYSVSGLPTLLIFKDGKAVERLVGLVPKSTITSNIEKHL